MTTTAFLLATILAAAPSAATTHKDYPCWRGPIGSGASSAGLKLTEDINKGQLIWKTEELPGVYGAFIQTGQTGPIVGDGKVFLVYHYPNDDVWDTEYAQKALSGWNPGAASFFAGELGRKAKEDPSLREALVRRKFAIAADDVVHCFDAATGKTLWKAVFERKGINCTFQGRGPFISSKCAPQSVPCSAAGKVFAYGNTGRIYCLNAADGKLVWESKLERFFAEYEGKKEKYRQARKLNDYGRMDLAHGPVYADGVLVCFDDYDSLIGINPETGAKLWTTKGKDMRKFYSAPIRWVHKGKEYVVSGGLAVEPKTGKLLWDVPMETAYEPGTAVVCEDYLIWGPCCYRITPEKTERLWKFPEDDKPGYRNGTPVIQNGLVIFRHQAPGHGFGDSHTDLVDLESGKLVGSACAPGTGTENGSFCGGDGRAFLELNRDAGTAIGMYVMDPGVKELKYSVLSAPFHAMSATPSYANGCLFLRMQDHIACYDLQEAVEPRVSAAAGQTDKAAAAKTLAELCGDSVPRVRRQAMWHLAQMGGDAQTAVPGVTTLFARPELHDSADVVRTIAALCKSAPPALTDALKSPDARVRTGALASLGTIGQPRDPVVAAIAGVATGDTDLPVRAEAVAWLARMKVPSAQLGGTAGKLLNDALSARSADAFGRTLAVLHEAGQTESALPAIFKAIESQEGAVAANALRALHSVPETKAAPALPALMAILKGEQLHNWSDAAALVQKISPPKCADAADVLSGRIRGGTTDQAKAALQTLGALGRVTKDTALKERTVKELTSVVAGGPADLKVTAIEQLGSLGPAAKSAVKTLYVAADNPALKKSADEALKKVAPPEADAPPSLDPDLEP